LSQQGFFLFQHLFGNYGTGKKYRVNGLTLHDLEADYDDNDADYCPHPPARHRKQKRGFIGTAAAARRKDWRAKLFNY
jgi:hypothetical protein